MHPDTSYHNFLQLYKTYKEIIYTLNESETRAKIIDSILRDCLGWPEKCIKREDHVASGFTDYQLLHKDICIIIIEAKKSGIYFDIPKSFTNRYYKISGVISSVTELNNAINQVHRYWVDVGCKYGAVFNGYQLVIFPAITIGKPWRDGQAILFNSIEDFINNYSMFWNILSREQVLKGSLINYLEKIKSSLSFSKILSKLHYRDELWPRNELYQFISPISKFIFSELLDETRTVILNDCYVFDKSNKYLTTDLNIFFKDSLPYFASNFKIKDVYEKASKAGSFQKEFERLSHQKFHGSLMVLLGGVGCGKSTFLLRFFKIILSNKENFLWFYVDFRDAPLKNDELEKFIIDKIQEDWEEKYEKNLSELIKNIGFNVPKVDIKLFFHKLFSLLRILKFSICLIIDNIDQHDSKLQEYIFILSSHLKEYFKTTTIVAMREETFIHSTRVGVFDAYDIPKFHISAPDFLQMIKKRISVSIALLEVDTFKMPKPKRDDIIKYFSVILSSLGRKNKQSLNIVKFIDSISVGNMRVALKMFNNFILSGNTNIKEIFDKHKPYSPYQISYHQFIKSILLGEYRYYCQDRSNIFNLFDFDTSISDSHFMSLRILNFFSENINNKSSIGRGYLSINELLTVVEQVSIQRSVLYDTLKRLSGFNLIEYDNLSRTDLEGASFVKITPSGLYYLNELIYEFFYLDSVIVDTPISETIIIDDLNNYIESISLDDRIYRTSIFIDYLVSSEDREFKEHPEFINSPFAYCRFADKIKKEWIEREPELKAKIF